MLCASLAQSRLSERDPERPPIGGVLSRIGGVLSSVNLSERYMTDGACEPCPVDRYCLRETPSEFQLVVSFQAVCVVPGGT